MPRDLTAILPQSVLVRFQGRRCSGLPADDYPRWYTSKVNLAEVLPDVGAGFAGTKVFHDAALALFSANTTVPTNQAALDALATQTARDYYRWKQASFDEVCPEIIAPTVDGLTDVIEWGYKVDQVWTRRLSAPYNDDVEELAHHDPANASCVDDLTVNPPMIVSKEPCFESYGPMVTGTSGSTSIEVYLNCLQGGLLVQQYSRTETLPCGCGCLWTFNILDFCSLKPISGAVVSVSLSGTEVATCTTLGNVLAVTRGATGSSFTSVPTVAIAGTGTGATAVADMQLGTLVRTSGGSGYNNGTFTGTFSGGGPGSGATFTFTVSGGVVQSTFTILTRGSGYTSLPTPNFSAAGAGTGAAASVTLNVLALTLTAGGTGYKTATVGITATVATGCTLNVPPGTYDVTVTPPTGSGYDAYSASLSHTCNQTTGVSLATDPSHICDTGCTQCAVMPSSVFITFTYGGSYTGFLWPNSTLTWDPARSGYASGVFDGPGGPTDPRQIFLTCQPAFSVYELRWATVPAGGGGGPFAHANFGPAITCTPFFIPNGVFDVNTSPAYGSWTAT